MEGFSSTRRPPRPDMRARDAESRADAGMGNAVGGVARGYLNELDQDQDAGIAMHDGITAGTLAIICVLLGANSRATSRWARWNAGSRAIGSA
jgi:hypothetical protein